MFRARHRLSAPDQGTMLAVSVPDVTLLFYCRKLSRLSMLTLHFFTLTNLNRGHLNIDHQV